MPTSSYSSSFPPFHFLPFLSLPLRASHVAWRAKRTTTKYPPESRNTITHPREERKRPMRKSCLSCISRALARFPPARGSRVREECKILNSWQTRLLAVPDATLSLILWLFPSTLFIWPFSLCTPYFVGGPATKSSTHRNIYMYVSRRSGNAMTMYTNVRHSRVHTPRSQPLYYSSIVSCRPSSSAWTIFFFSVYMRQRARFFAF